MTDLRRSSQVLTRVDSWAIGGGGGGGVLLIN